MSDPNRTFRDKFGMTWNVLGPTPRGTYTAALQQPAYGTQPGDEVLSATKSADLIEEANAYAEAYIASGGKPPGRASTTVTASKGGVGVLLLLAFALWASDR